jgi:hypothetical protein
MSVRFGISICFQYVYCHTGASGIRRTSGRLLRRMPEVSSFLVSGFPPARE